MTPISFELDLLDTGTGQVLQTWKLGDSDLFQLGRSRESEVILSNPYVSRTHACLRRNDDDAWELSAISRHGIFVDGQRVENLLLEDGVVFRLAEAGPFLRFRSETSGDSMGDTMAPDPRQTPVFVLNEQQRDQEVSEIAEGEYFQELKRKLALLRGRPEVNEPTWVGKAN